MIPIRVRCGLLVCEATLGRETERVPDPLDPGHLGRSVDEVTPYPVKALLDENFRAVKIVACDSVSAAISSDGELRVWGSFKVSQSPRCDCIFDISISPP